tara:strand:+ start:58729 stop:58842 length:114 start_codon:yes stop_codon:yes gene_type:complete
MKKSIKTVGKRITEKQKRNIIGGEAPPVEKKRLKEKI